VPLSLLGGLAGIVLAWGGLRLFRLPAAPPNFPRLNELALGSFRFLGFTALVGDSDRGSSSASSPAIQASNPDLVGSLKESGRSGTDGVARQHMRSALVAIQIAMGADSVDWRGINDQQFSPVFRTILWAPIRRNLLTFDFRFFFA